MDSVLPSREIELFTDEEVWLKEKRELDNKRRNIPSNLWCIDNKLYDLSKFINKHPGGEMWLKITKGQDITEYFHTHHINQKKVRLILKQYEVNSSNDVKVNSDSIFTFKKNDFYDTIRTRINELMKNDTGPTIPMQIYCFCILLSWFISFYFMCITGNILYAIISGWLLHVLFCIGHNFFHQASLWRFAVDLSGFSSRTWRVIHAISHHHHTNLLLDCEVNSLEPFQYFLTSKPKNKWFIFIYCHIFWASVASLDWFVRFIRCSIFQPSRFRLEYLIFPAEWIVLYWFQGPKWGSILFFTMQGIMSYLLLIQSTLTHRSGYAWTDGDGTDGKNTRDFGIHVVMTTCDHSHNMNLLSSLLIFGLFENHILHHLFPTEARVILEETCKEFGIKYHKYTALQLFTDSFSGIWRTKYHNPLGKSK